MLNARFFCIPIFLNNPIKACFLREKKYNWFLKIVGVKTQLPISFGTALACKKMLKVWISNPTHSNLLFLISYSY